MAKTRKYVNNRDLLADLVKYKVEVRKAQKAGVQIPSVSTYVGDCIIKIATNLAKKSNFSNYTYKDEMISDGIENCIMYIHNFNEDKSNNPFAYITQIIRNAFIRRIQKEKKQAKAKAKVFENMVIFNEGTGMANEDSVFFQEFYDTEINSNIIENNSVKKKPMVKKKVKAKPFKKVSLKKFYGENK